MSMSGVILVQPGANTDGMFKKRKREKENDNDLGAPIAILV